MWTRDERVNELGRRRLWPEHIEAKRSRLITSNITKLLKRYFDVVCAMLLILFTSPLLFCLSLAVVANWDGGSIVYRQKRVGQGGRVFNCLKFRSMCVNADEVLCELLEREPTLKAEWAETHKLQVDPRVTRIGRILRSTSLDELPQLWNVLVGDMSLVGPRPITQAEVDGPYQRLGARQDYLSVRPGITGLWQISGRSGVSYEDRVALDRDYVRNLSATRDLAILFRTVGVVMRRDGAC